jgi:hypothetical protein
VDLPQPGDVLSQLVVLNESSILRLVAADDAVVTVENEFPSPTRLSSCLVERTFLLNDLCRNTEANMPIDAAAAMPVVLVLCLLDHQFVAQEVCRFGGRMRNQGLFFRQFQLECFVQEVFQLGFDLLCFHFGASKSQAEMISVAKIA